MPAARILAGYPAGFGPRCLNDALLAGCGGMWRENRTAARLTPLRLLLHSHTSAWLLLEPLQPDVKHRATIPGDARGPCPGAPER